MLGGCTAPPQAVLDRSTPASWQQATDTGAQGAPGATRLRASDLATWWRSWNEPQLNALVEQALAQNLSLAQARGRLRQQRLLQGVADAAYRPELNGNIRTLQDVAAIDSYFHASIDMVWDLGLFGARESHTQAARAELLSAQAQLEAAQVALVADVVHRWLDIRMAQAQRQLLGERVALDERTLHWAQVRLAQRLDGSEAVYQAQLQLTQSQKQDSALQESQARAAHALALLLGQARPDPAWLARSADARLPAPPPLQLEMLPADLLRTRPDIQAAEAGVLRAAAALGLSRAALKPRFALGGSLLFSYNLTQNHRTTSDHIPVLGPVIDIPLFDWSRRRSQAAGDEAALDVAVLGYRQSVLESISEVEAALAALQAQQARMTGLAQTARQIAARDALQQRREQLGLAGAYQRANEQRALLQNRSEQVVAQASQALAYVSLYKALGGAPLPEAAATAPEAKP
ncbi:TolC family protein [Comamonas sp. J-3]|uniref:TolC family protein n=1 Tax=Comamonas trifloxystrobinivorans TaxID=3350256 RepID=UPI00372D6DA3